MKKINDNDKSNITVVESNQSILPKLIKSNKPMFDMTQLISALEYIFDNLDRYPSLHNQIKNIIIDNKIEQKQDFDVSIADIPDIPEIKEDIPLGDSCEDINHFLVHECLVNINILNNLPLFRRFKPKVNDAYIDISSESEITRDGNIYFRINIVKLESHEIIIYPFGFKKDDNILDKYNIHGNIKIKIKSNNLFGYAYGKWSSSIEKINIIKIDDYQLNGKNLQLSEIDFPLELEFWNH